MIAPSSYPVDGAESIVNIKLLKALSDSGKFEIDLIARKRHWSNYVTASFESYGINVKSLNVITVDNKINLKTIWGHFKALLLFGVVFKGAHWAVKVLPIVKRLIKENRYDYVLTKNASSLLLGYYAKKHYGQKWIATWNDPYPEKKYPEPYGRGYDAKENWYEKRIISIMNKWVDIHIFPSERLKNHMQHYLRVDEKKTCIIPHVVLPQYVSSQKVSDDKLRLIHSGNLKSPRNPESFLKALKIFVDKHINPAIEFTILGVCDEYLSDKISELGLEEYVKFIPPVSYSESLNLLKDYHVAVIIEADCKEGIFLPTKVSDFMQCKKQIFAVSPKVGVLNDLYKKGAVSYFGVCDDVNSIYATMEKIYSDYKDDVLNEKGDMNKSYASEIIVNQYLSF